MGCLGIYSEVGRPGLELDGMSVAFNDKASESEIYKGAQTF